MANNFTQATDSQNIKEYQYAVAETIKFAVFTSCIGVVAKVKEEDKVIGIHLAFYTHGSNLVETEVVFKVMNILRLKNYDENEVLVMGSVASWQRSASKIYSILKLFLKIQNTKNEFSFGDGIYGAKISEGKIEILY